MSCNCINRIESALAEHKLDVAIMLRGGNLTTETYTRLNRRDNGRAENRSSKPKVFAHKFCPFCGEQYDGQAHD